MVSDRSLSVCPVCDVGVLWPNGWMDQDATWYEGIGLGLGHIVLGGHPAPPQRGTAPNFRPMSVVAKRSPISATAERLSSFSSSGRVSLRMSGAGCFRPDVLAVAEPAASKHLRDHEARTTAAAHVDSYQVKSYLNLVNSYQQSHRDHKTKGTYMRLNMSYE